MVFFNFSGRNFVLRSRLQRNSLKILTGILLTQDASLAIIDKINKINRDYFDLFFLLLVITLTKWKEVQIRALSPIKGSPLVKMVLKSEYISIFVLIFTNLSLSLSPKGLLEIATNDVNSHTYVYEPNLSLRRMTIEAFPSEENYAQQDIKNLQDHR